MKLEQDEETTAPYYAISYARHYRNEKRYPVWLDDPIQVWGKRLLPIHLLRPDSEAEQELEEWAAQAAEEDTREVLRIVKEANRLRQKFAKVAMNFHDLLVEGLQAGLAFPYATLQGEERCLLVLCFPKQVRCSLPDAAPPPTGSSRLRASSS